MGIEPATDALQKRCSTVELLRQKLRTWIRFLQPSPRVLWIVTARTNESMTTLGFKSLLSICLFIFIHKLELWARFELAAYSLQENCTTNCATTA